ncbi:hypothetical protein [Lysinibacillus sp. GbtcB16]|nr:hypothetical protein [Lysinibacillus sp. GbtcB16]
MHLEQPRDENNNNAVITNINEAEGENCDPEPGLASEYRYAF